MRKPNEILDQSFLEMRWRCLSLAADLDRIARSPGGGDLVKNDGRLVKFRRALRVLLEAEQDRAEQVQLIFSDMTPPPP